MAEDTEFARKAQRALEEKEERRIEELKQMEEKMKARAKQGQVFFFFKQDQVSLSVVGMHKVWLLRRLYSGSVPAVCMLLL